MTETIIVLVIVVLLPIVLLRFKGYLDFVTQATETAHQTYRVIQVTAGRKPNVYGSLLFLTVAFVNSPVKYLVKVLHDYNRQHGQETSV